MCMCVYVIIMCVHARDQEGSLETHDGRPGEKCRGSGERDLMHYM